MKIVAIIPARYHSNRLPRKLLAEIAGQSILHRVYSQAQKADVFDDIVVATDHQEIVDHCESNDMKVQLTSDTHISGTDRIAEVAATMKADIIINIQGDEPFIEVDSILALVNLLQQEAVEIGTLCKEIKDEHSIFDFNCVKLVKNKLNKVLYFSRQAIPALRDKPFREWPNEAQYFQHIGLYGFKKETLLELVKLPPSTLEISEKLEQLRWLENGYSIQCAEVISDSFGIDTQEGLDKARAIYK